MRPKDVNELAIRNLSNQDIYVQAGDIVRGGDQDRMISVDFIVPPKSGRMPIAAFCVESGRWSKRGNEEQQLSAALTTQLHRRISNSLPNGSNSQEAVWKNVNCGAREVEAQYQGREVADGASASSFELSVETAKVKETTEEYIKALSGNSAKQERCDWLCLCDQRSRE